MHVGNHTRVECRVLCILARGGKIAEVEGRAEGLPSIFDTGPKRNKQGQTKTEFMKAHNLDRGSEEEPTAARSDFVGATISMEQSLFDRLVGAGFVTKKGRITEEGRAHYQEAHAGATRVMECVGHDDVDATQAAFAAGDVKRISKMLIEETNHDDLAVVLSETGFGGRAGMSTAGCCQAAGTIRSIVDRLGPDERS